MAFSVSSLLSQSPSDEAFGRKTHANSAIVADGKRRAFSRTADRYDSFDGLSAILKDLRHWPRIDFSAR